MIREGITKDTLYRTLTDQFKVECSDRSSEIDPENELCWKSLTAGWAIAKGLDPEDAYDFAHYIRYKTDLG